MKIVFFGTPEFVIPILDRLYKVFKPKSGESPIVAVVTQPPKPSGRKRLLKYSAVDTWAHKKKIPIYFDARKLIEDKVEADIGIIASYGEIIPKEVIDYFPNGILNIHFSLLPKFRGASPVQAAIVAGEKEIGVTIFKIDEKLDHGPIVSQFKEEILPTDTTSSLRARLFSRTSEVLTFLLPAYLQGKIKLREQDHKKATYTKILKKDDAFIPQEFLQACLQGKTKETTWKIDFIKDFEIKPTPEVIERFIRAMQPWPIAWSKIRTKNQERRIKILKAHLEPLSATSNQPPATKLVLDEVQLEGKTKVSWQQFKQGYPEAEFVFEIPNPDVRT